MLELVCRKSSKVCLCAYISVCLCVSVCEHMCVLELEAPVSVHTLKPVSNSAALSSYFSLKLLDITANTAHKQTHTYTHVFHWTCSHHQIFTHLNSKSETHFKTNIFLSQFKVSCYLLSLRIL